MSRTSMEVFFSPTKGNPFYMTVEFTDTVEDVKRKIEASQSIPPENQTLIYNDKLIPSNTDFTRFRYLKPAKNECCLKIIVVVTYIPPDDILFDPQDTPEQEVKKVQILMKLPVTNQWECIKIDVVHTVRKLKRVIGRLIGEDENRIVIRHDRVDNQELADDGEWLYYCGIDSFRELKVSLRPRRNSPPREKLVLPEKQITKRLPMKRTRREFLDEGGWNKKEIITVILEVFGEMIEVKVPAAENVSILRRELERLKGERPELVFPEGEGIIFIDEGDDILEETENFHRNFLTDGSIITILEVEYDDDDDDGADD